MNAVRLLTWSVAMTVLGAAASASPGVSPTAPISYDRDVRPILEQHCQGCHQPARPQGGFIVTNPTHLVRPGDSGRPGIVPFHPEKSLLLEQVVPTPAEARMPQGSPPLAPSAIDVLRNWIAQGAQDDTPPGRSETVDQDHPPVYHLPPVVTALDFSPDGNLLAVSGYHEVLLHHADGSGLIARLVGRSERVQSLAFSPDGKLLAVTGGCPGRFGEVQIWDVRRRRLRLSIPVTYDTVFGASWSPDGRLVAFGCADHTVRAVDVHSSRQVLQQGAHADWVLGTAFSRDGSHLVSVSRDHTMKLTEVNTQRFIDDITSITPNAQKGGLQAVNRHPARDELLVGGADGAPRIYRMHRTRKRVIGDDYNLMRAFETLPGRLFAVRYSPDGALVAAGSSSNGRGEVRTYRANDGKTAARMAGQQGPVYALAFRPDGRQLASGGFDGRVRINDVADGRLCAEFVPVQLEPLSKAGQGARGLSP